MFHLGLAILIRKQNQQQNHLPWYTEREGFAIHPQPNGAILEQALSQWKADVLQELFDNFFS